jgi:sulfopyruvate decarboxylase TPP-binding subunit
MRREVAAEIVDSLKEAGIDFVATLTEANLHDLVMALGEDTDIHHVPVTREEEGIGICAGAYLGGKNPAMVMMNAGHPGTDADRPQRRGRRGKRRSRDRR